MTPSSVMDGSNHNARAGGFPSLIIRPEGFQAQGAFAQAQAAFLEPDPEQVAQLEERLRRHQAGLVAHYYMDAELQGVLSSCSWPHIHVADSLMMADRAVRMAEDGARVIVVLGVDFMSENVRATLDASGFGHVPVYRVAADPIGCSLAESAEAPAYGAYLTKAARTPRSLHVIYVNTSLRTKARAQRLIPTITCTSSNVLPLMLQAFAQVPDLRVWFGPDTYMGENLQHMLSALSTLGPEAIRRLHPEHTPESLRQAAERFEYFRQGVCVVHHMFGHDIVEQVRRGYDDAYVTAHLEVPGEMFALGFDAQRQGRGVVGSTSNILKFITDKVQEHAREHESAHLRFILGTEAGMVTPIAHGVRDILRRHSQHTAGTLQAEIVFPVASGAVAHVGDPELELVPGIRGGEGCSTAGGCATCPFMKMNSLDALLDLLARLDGNAPLGPYEPKKYTERIAGKSVAELGGRSIVAMRAFQKSGRLPDDLVQDIETRAAPRTDESSTQLRSR